ncbi:MAG: hypothetical protein ABI629_21550, partial [bacterium]
NAEGEFRETLGFLESGGLMKRLAAEARSVIYVPTEKRLALDFYKNNTIHFFLVPALAIDARRRGLRDGELQDDVSWWLDLLRWEFPLPERQDLAAELARVEAYLREVDALGGADGDTLDVSHPFVATAITLLDNFREAYWIAAQALLELPEAATPQNVALERLQKRYRAGMLLGEVRKPEGNSSMTLGNALSRFAELECLTLRAGKGRERLVSRGPRFLELADVAARIGASIVNA